METETTKIRESDLWRAVNDASADLREHVQKHPYGSVAAAAGVGYVLAGGLLTRLTARFLKFGVKAGATLMAWPMVGRAIEGLTEAIEAERGPRSRLDS